MKINTPTEAMRAVSTMQGDLLVISTYLRTALEQLDQAMPGFPSGLDGAGAGDGLTQVERLATTPDEARTLQRRLFERIGTGFDALADVAILAKQIGRTPARPQVVKGDTPEGWCENHYRLLHVHEPTRRPGGTYCRFCEDVKRPPNSEGTGGWGALPSRALLELKARKSRVSTADVDRLMKGKAA